MTPLEWVGFVFFVILWTVLIDIRDQRRIEAKRAEAFRWAEANGGLSRAQLEAYQKTDGPTMSEIVAAREEEYENRRPLPPVIGCPGDYFPTWEAPPVPIRDFADEVETKNTIQALLEDVGGR